MCLGPKWRGDIQFTYLLFLKKVYIVIQNGFGFHLVCKRFFFLNLFTWRNIDEDVRSRVFDDGSFFLRGSLFNWFWRWILKNTYSRRSQRPMKQCLFTLFRQTKYLRSQFFIPEKYKPLASISECALYNIWLLDKTGIINDHSVETLHLNAGLVFVLEVLV